MSGPGATPLFVETSALYARLDGNDANHDAARAAFDAIRDGDLVYRPLFVTSHVLGELATLAVHELGPAAAVDVLSRLGESPLLVTLYPDAADVDGALQQLARHDDRAITLVDHLTAVLADDRGVEAVFAFDDDFRTPGFSVVPVQ